MEVAVYNIKGTETGNKIQLEDEIFAVEPNDHVMYLDVKQYLANQRQGTHKTKEKSEVSGSTKKLKRQKGTGTARAGSVKSPTFVGGARCFGPRPRDYSFKLNKKVKQLARKSALTYKFNENALVVVENFDFETPKTKEIVKIKENLKISDKKVLFILANQNINVYLSSRNLEGVKVVTVSELTTYDILNASKVVFTENAVEVLTENFGLSNS